MSGPRPKYRALEPLEHDVVLRWLHQHAVNRRETNDTCCRKEHRVEEWRGLDWRWHDRCDRWGGYGGDGLRLDRLGRDRLWCDRLSLDRWSRFDLLRCKYGLEGD